MLWIPALVDLDDTPSGFQVYGVKKSPNNSDVPNGFNQ
jgi:hypothetical protein